MKRIIVATLAATVLAACSSSDNGWSISGTVEGAGQDTRIAIERFNNGSWMVMDSITVDIDGSFKYTSPEAAPYPDVLRLSLNGSSIYFPVDSIDHITVTANAGNFASGYKMEGSAQATTIASIDSIINANLNTRGVEALLADNDLKKEIFTLAFNNESLLPMYYVINKSVGDNQLFDISNPADLRLFRAVAQRFNVERPDDPRTAYLVQQATSVINSDITTTIEVPETALIDIVRFDEKGVSRSLSEMASKGNVVVLSFTTYEMEKSPAYNVILNNVWEKYHDSGLDIYQIAFDEDQTMWQIRAANLPWTTVWNSNTDSKDPLLKYNVGTLPMTYIIDRKGQIASRVADPAELESSVAKYI